MLCKENKDNSRRSSEMVYPASVPKKRYAKSGIYRKRLLNLRLLRRSLYVKYRTGSLQKGGMIICEQG